MVTMQTQVTSTEDKAHTCKLLVHSALDYKEYKHDY